MKKKTAQFTGVDPGEGGGESNEGPPHMDPQGPGGESPHDDPRGPADPDNPRDNPGAGGNSGGGGPSGPEPGDGDRGFMKKNSL